MTNPQITMAEVFDPTVNNPLPVCFPFAGRVWADGQVGFYKIYNQKFPMPIHGFLHEVSPNVNFHKKGPQIFHFQSNPETLKMFPFHFAFKISWEVFENRIRGDFTVTYESCEVANSLQMPVSFGLHPYFASDISEDWVINSSAKEFRRVTTDGNASDKTEDLDSGGLSTQSSMAQSLILENLSSDELYFGSSTKKLKIRFGPEKDFRYVVLWRGRNANFQCIEPWTGLPDAINRKDGCYWLNKGEQKNWWFEVEKLTG